MPLIASRPREEEGGIAPTGADSRPPRPSFWRAETVSTVSALLSLLQSECRNALREAPKVPLLHLSLVEEEEQE